MPRQRRLVLLGYYGSSNAGDEAILGVLLAYLRGSHRRHSVVVLTGNPARTQEDHRVEARSYRDMDTVMDALAGADALIVGGGGLLHDHWGWQPETVLTSGHWGLSLFAGIPLAAAARGIPVAMLAQGVGPLRSAAAQGFSVAAFEAASLITVRDRESRRTLRTLGIQPGRIHLTADLGLLVPFTHAVASRHLTARPLGHQVARDRVGIALRFWDRDVEPIRWQQAVAEGLRRFLQTTGARAVFVPFQHSTDPRGDDAAVAHLVADEIGLPDQCHIVSGPLTVGATVETIAGCDLVLAMRYHAAVFGIVAGTPPVGITYDRKVANLMQDTGLGAFACCLSALTAERVSAMMGDAWRRRDSLEERLSVVRPCLVAAARRSLSLLGRWLQRLPAVRDRVRRRAEEALEWAMLGRPPAS